MTRLDRIKGCLLGGAVGGALGAPLALLPWSAIEARFGPAGVDDFVPAQGLPGAVTDGTQMMCFTAEGLLRAHVRGSLRGICHTPSVIHHALLRWLLTQGEKPACSVSEDGWLLQQHALWVRRTPGATCLAALQASRRFGDQARNDSKGCGALIRVAACACFDNAFTLAAESAQLTHGHPGGYLVAGLFADILRRLAQGTDCLETAVRASLGEWGDQPGLADTRTLLLQVLARHADGQPPTPQTLAELGSGWLAEQTLAMGLWCALQAESFEQGVRWAVNHSGNSDSTGLVAGHLLGMQRGAAAIPQRWLARLELRGVIEQLAEDLEAVPRVYHGSGADQEAAIEARYPGW